jgi:hypothetical protein
MSALTAEQIAAGAELGMGPAAVERALILATAASAATRSDQQLELAA